MQSCAGQFPLGPYRCLTRATDERCESRRSLELYVAGCGSERSRQRDATVNRAFRCCGRSTSSTTATARSATDIPAGRSPAMSRSSRPSRYCPVRGPSARKAGGLMNVQSNTVFSRSSVNASRAARAPGTMFAGTWLGSCRCHSVAQSRFADTRSSAVVAAPVAASRSDTTA